MITSDDFLTQCYVFGVLFNTSPPPPGFVTLQVAYDGDGNILLADGFPINVTDSASLIALNLDPGSRKMYTDYNIEARGGITSHILNQAIAGNIIVSQNELDRVNVNNTSNDYGLTFPAGDTFPNGSELAAVQEAPGGSVTLKFPTGVFLNGIDNTTFVINEPYQNVIVRRISSANWMVVYESPGLLDLQNAYDQSPTKQIVMDSTGLNFMTGANNTFLINQSGNTSYANFNILYSNFSSEFDSNQEIHQALKNSSVPADSPTYSYIYNGINDADTTPATPFLKIDTGYHCKTAGLESGFYKLTLKSEGNQYNLFGFQGSFDPTSDPKQAQVIAWISNNVDQFLVGTTSSQNYVSVFDVFSPGNDQGSRPIPRLTDTQINSIDTSSIDQTFPLGLMAYNTTYDIIKYLASDTAFKTMVIKEKLVQGSNVSIDTSNPDGSVIISSTGGGVSVDLAQCQIFVENNSTPVNFSSTAFVPVVVDPATWLSPIRQVGMTGLLSSFSSYSNIPSIKSNSTGTRWFDVKFVLSVKCNGSLTNTYDFTFGIIQAGGTVVQTVYPVRSYFNSTINGGVVVISGLVPLSNGDTVFVYVADQSPFDPLYITNITAQAVDTSTNGISGTAGNCAVFSSGGGVQDGGIFDGGTWTPTLTSVAGISGSATLINAFYSRSKNIVTYSMQVTAVVTNSTITLGITPPVASAFAGSYQANGTGTIYDTSSPTAFDGSVNSVIADTVNARLQANIVSTIGSGTKNFTITGSYLIV